MSSTPQLKSSFPQTPKTNEKTRGRVGGYPKEKPIAIKLATQDANSPLVPFDVVDAPSQRLYVVAFYLALNAWRLYEYYVSSDELDSTWLFLKWASIDGVFLFALPALRIPWLEWAFSTTLALFLIHAVANVFLMFRIPVSNRISEFPVFAFGESQLINEFFLDPTGCLGLCFGESSI